MRTRTFVLAVLLSATVTLSAQENEKIKYSNITEFGFVTTSPMGVSFEATTVQGFALEKQHHVGLGLGIGGSFYDTYRYGTAYMPVFVNYRLYFKPEKTFSPQVNTALGGLITEDGGGFYSSITMGFRAGKFSFSSGLSFMAVHRTEEWNRGYQYYDPNTGLYIWIEEHISRPKWHFPFGITLKCGFTF